jgi:hypothetical protein
MRLAPTLLLLALGLAVAAPALALVPTCASSCNTDARVGAFVLPAAILPTGTSMTWTSVDVQHFVADGTTAAASCVSLPVPGLQASAPVTFTIEADGLHAETGASSGGGWSGASGADPLCAATQLPDGSFALPYRCLIHPEMRGVILVTP